jgi:hypothetical protein
LQLGLLPVFSSTGDFYPAHASACHGLQKCNLRVILASFLASTLSPLAAGKLTKPDSEDPEPVNHLNWYMSTGFTRPYPGEKTIRPPSDFKKPAPTTLTWTTETRSGCDGPLSDGRREGFLFTLQTQVHPLSPAI